MSKQTKEKRRVVGKTETTGWEPWPHGRGWSLKLADGLKCSVSKSIVRNEGFGWNVFGLHGKNTLSDAAKAKGVAERVARRLLEEAIESLPTDAQVENFPRTTQTKRKTI